MTGNKKEAYMFRIYCKDKNRIQQRKQVIQSDQDVHVCGIFLDGTRTPFCMTLSFILRYGLTFFFFFLFLFFLASGLEYIFSFAQLIPFCMMKSQVKVMEFVFYVGMEDMFLRNFQCRSQHEYIWSVCDLDLKSMKRISQGSQTI